jgi:hypothetical protein
MHFDPFLFFVPLADAAAPAEAKDALKDLGPLRDVLVSLGGWWVILWTVSWHAAKKVGQIVSDMTSKLDNLDTQIGRLRIELRRLRQTGSPPRGSRQRNRQPKPAKEE